MWTRYRVLRRARVTLPVLAAWAWAAVALSGIMGTGTGVPIHTEAATPAAHAEEAHLPPSSAVLARITAKRSGTTPGPHRFQRAIGRM